MRAIALLGTTLCISLASAPTAAEEGVTLYGVADVYIEHITNGDNRPAPRVESGGLAGSRLGVRVVERLGTDLRAGVVLESGFNLNDGTPGQGGRFFGRQSYVHVGGSGGELRVGRQRSPLADLAQAARIGTTSYDATGALADAIEVADDFERIDNAVQYLAPTIGGVSVAAMASSRLDGQEGGNDPAIGRNFGARAIYRRDATMLGVAYHANRDSAVTRQREWLAAGSLEVGHLRLSAFVGEHRGGARTRTLLAGVKASVALANRVTITVGLAQGRRAGPSNDSTVAELKLRHDLSRRTALYAQLTAVRNQSAVTTELNDVPNGGGSNDPRALRVGINHSF